ncbi:MAG: cellulose biosynthesis cyclic di-GMP-binding regulatory protein BcsB [Bacteroidales bacterium]|nr:cellulose biosynthesis cyclic di-GMP-binding regulatory protein BcsB [Bacteroidales bacterium]
MVKLSRFGFFVSLLLLACSCDNMTDVVVGDPYNFKLGGIQNNAIAVTADLPVSNHKNFAFKLKEMQLEVRVNDRYLGDLTLTKELRVPANTDGVYTLPMEIKVKNLMLGLSTFYNVSHKRDIMASIEGDIFVHYLLFRKKIKVKEEEKIRF